MDRFFFQIGLLFLCVFGQSTFGKVTLIKQDETGVTLKLEMAQPERSPIEINGVKYTSVVVDGFRNQVPEGSPELPYDLFFVSVPKNKMAVVERVTPIKVSTLKLDNDIAFQPVPLSHSDAKRTIQRDEKAYQRVFGDPAVVLEEVSFLENEKLGVFRWEPIFYDAPRRMMKWSKETIVDIKWVNARGLDDAPLPHSNQFSANQYLSINPHKKVPGRESKEPKDLIIAHADYQQALMRLVWFKKAQGRSVKEYYLKDRTNEQIKQIIKEEYKSSEPPTTTLLVGNIDQIPSWNGTGDCAFTDYPYQALDSGTLPDVALGRVPAHNTTELEAFIVKAISRESDPRDDKQVLLTAGRDTSLGCPANVTKVGEQFKSGGGDVTLVKKYRTEVSTEQVLNAYNENPNIVIYDGHGNRFGMIEIPTHLDSLQVFKNKTYPIVLDIACLNASWEGGANKRNYAEKYLLMPNGGAAGIMASGGSGYGHDFFQSIAFIMGQAQKSLASDPNLNLIGRVIMLAKTKHGHQDKTYWNYYGDPASKVWTAQSSAPTVRQIH